jgi:hypothetical protein
VVSSSKDPNVPARGGDGDKACKGSHKGHVGHGWPRGVRQFIGLRLMEVNSRECGSVRASNRSMRSSRRTKIERVGIFMPRAKFTEPAPARDKIWASSYTNRHWNFTLPSPFYPPLAASPTVQRRFEMAPRWSNTSGFHRYAPMA